MSAKMEFPEGSAARRALLRYDWSAMADRFADGKMEGQHLDETASSVMHDLSWAFNGLFREFGRGHLTFSVDDSLAAVEAGFPDYDYELKRHDCGWFFRLGNYEGKSFAHKSLAIYQAICLVIARWRLEAESGVDG
jgi:hypothetical protein